MNNKDKLQELVNVCFYTAIELHCVLGNRRVSRDYIAQWVADVLLTYGYPTVPVGSIWGKLVNVDYFNMQNNNNHRIIEGSSVNCSLLDIITEVTKDTADNIATAEAPTGKYYVAIYNSDSTEGRGVTLRTPFYFRKREDAEKFVETEYYARKYGVWGNPGSKYDVQEVDFSKYHFCSSFEDAARAAGISLESDDDHESCTESKEYKEKAAKLMREMSHEEMARELARLKS